jgi:hypothetical protein
MLKMANTTQEKQTPAINFSLNLTNLALHQLDFLEFIDKCRFYYTDEGARRAAYRYEKYWLPFYTSMVTGGETAFNLCPPYDIAWIWHCHLLSPIDYRRDCERVCGPGNIPDHFCFSKNDIESKQDYTRRLWEQNLPGVEFYVTESGDSEVAGGFKTSIGYDLVAASGRQKKFYYNVSLPHFKTQAYLELCMARYVKFLTLKLRRPKLFCVPCYGIDLIWHTHQLNPIVYEKETRELLGYLLPHDDTSDDRAPDAPLGNALTATKEAWREEFGESFHFDGGMYRGEAPFFTNDYSAKVTDLTPFYSKFGHFKLEDAM